MEVTQLGERTGQALKNRFDRHIISKNNQELIKLQNANPKQSGENDEAYKERLSEIFRANFGRPFRFMKCLAYGDELPVFKIMVAGNPVITGGVSPEMPVILQCRMRFRFTSHVEMLSH